MTPADDIECDRAFDAEDLDPPALGQSSSPRGVRDPRLDAGPRLDARGTVPARERRQTDARAARRVDEDVQPPAQSRQAGDRGEPLAVGSRHRLEQAPPREADMHLVRQALERVRDVLDARADEQRVGGASAGGFA
jgi:hypothetical protein